jgi:hypothetical protein
VSAVHHLVHRGHLLEVTLTRKGALATAELRVDGTAVSTRSAELSSIAFEVATLDSTPAALAGLTVRAAAYPVVGGPGRVQLVLPGALTPTFPAGLRRHRRRTIPFEPPEGTRAHRSHQWQRRHPWLAASRHVVIAVAQVAVALLTLRLALSLDLWGWLPQLRPPRIDLPTVRLPDLPRIPFPDLPEVPRPHPPAWLLAVLQSRTYWAPVLLAIVVAVAEVRRRRRHEQEREEVAHAWREPSTQNATGSGASPSSTRPSPASPGRDSSGPPLPPSAGPPASGQAPSSTTSPPSSTS